MKRLIILCDGTWNAPDKAAKGVPVPTNVVRLAEGTSCVHNGVVQRLYYDPGIGSSGSWLQRTYDGATGHGISANILEAYEFLIRNYNPGDELFLFGFSRGAFTVRSLAGLIRNSGILQLNANDIMTRAFQLYRSRSRATQPREREAELFRRTFAVMPETPIHFIGVWDTVGALGNPLYLGQLNRRNRFHDTCLSRYAAHAYQALAIDEWRINFRPAIWNLQPGNPNQKLEQRWFIGSHSNVGGGYQSRALSDIPLKWLLERAEAAGLGCSTTGLNPDFQGPLTSSWTWGYRLLPRHFRPIADEDPNGATNETIDDSAFARIVADRTYRPRNLIRYLDGMTHPYAGLSPLVADAIKAIRG
jgi:uncharacterized protein (DUF2235 family)